MSAHATAMRVDEVDDFMVDDFILDDEGLGISSDGYHDFSLMSQPATCLAEDVFNPMDDY